MRLYCTLLLLLLFVNISFAQKKRTIEKANQLYQQEQYAEAIPMFEDILEKQPSLSLKTKLAYAYKVNNNLTEAEKLYAEVVQNDKAKAITWFYYGETLIANSKYKEAKKWLQEYQKAAPKDKRVPLLIATCEQVEEIVPLFPPMTVRPFPYNSPADDNTAVFFNNKIIFTSDRPQGVKLLKKKSGWTGRDYLRLYESEMTMSEEGYNEARPYSGKLNELNKNTGNPSFTADGKEIFFAKNSNELSKSNAYNLQLFTATTEGDEKWKDVEKLDFCSLEYNYMHPAVSPNGKYLFFVADKSRGEGGTDIYWSKRKRDGTWGKIKSLGATINTASHEGFPFFHGDNELYFCSKGHLGYGGFDIFVSQLNTATEEWSTPVNLGAPINSSLDDISIYINEDKLAGAFTSSRANGDDDIYLFEIGGEILANTEFNEKSVQVTAPQLVQTEAPKETTNPQLVEEEVASIDTETLSQKREAIAVEETVMMQIDSAVHANLSPVEKPIKKKKIVKSVPIQPVKSIPVSPPKTIAIKEKGLSIYQLSEQLATRSYAFNANQDLILDKAAYGQGKYEVSPAIGTQLDELSQLLLRFPNVEIEIGGHTDEANTMETQNRKLSEVRAYSAAAYLVGKGIATSRIVPRGYGSQRLAANVLSVKILAF